MSSSIRLTVAVPCMGGITETKGQWGCLVANTVNKRQVELLVIDNNSPDDTVAFLERFVFPHFPHHRLIRNPDNVGMVASLQQCYTESKGEIVAILHNDLYIFERGWDARVMRVFDNYPKLGLAGFFGSKIQYPDGHRGESYTNLLEAEAHGAHRCCGTENVVIFDGLALIARRAMLDQVGGIDQSYTYHHFYDRDIALTSHFAGWENKVIGVYCHHRGGLTASRGDYAKWIASKMGTEIGQGDLASYRGSEQYWFGKWRHRLPVSVK